MKKLHDCDVWSEDFNKISITLQSVIELGNKWVKTCNELTCIFWPNYALHIWNGEPYISKNISNLVERVTEVLSIRKIHKQLIRLLTTVEQEDLHMKDMFSPFEVVDVFRCISYDGNVWNGAQTKFQFLLKPAEQRVATKLGKQFVSINANTRQVI